MPPRNYGERRSILLGGSYEHVTRAGIYNLNLTYDVELCKRGFRARTMVNACVYRDMNIQAVFLRVIFMSVPSANRLTNESAMGFRAW